MSTNDILPQTLGFLTDAAHLLSKAAPETSAYLMAQRNTRMFNNNLQQSDVQRQHVCGACGHIMIPGQGSELKLETDKAIRKRSQQKGKRASTSRKRFTCGMCKRYTDISAPPATAISRRHPIKPAKRLGAVPRPNTSTPPLPEPVKASANVSSKKRAKSRKQGLQALLQQAQSSTSKPQNGLGLSLSDFMKK
ncbi:hypothetical protein F4819DRAFT_219973 [Hypoxylon fuscum]|nr:hypothetical protein F4819DRAFT_219973 [Hypoxylon fuscum]